MTLKGPYCVFIVKFSMFLKMFFLNFHLGHLQESRTSAFSAELFSSEGLLYVGGMVHGFRGLVVRWRRDGSWFQSACCTLEEGWFMVRKVTD